MVRGGWSRAIGSYIHDIVNNQILVNKLAMRPIPFEIPSAAPLVLMPGELNGRPAQVVPDTGNGAPFTLLVSPAASTTPDGAPGATALAARQPIVARPARRDFEAALSEPPFVVETNAQLKVIADPLRQRILAAFAKAPTTVKAAAAALDLAPTRLYRHVDMLVAAGFLKAVAEVQRRGAVERTFAATATRITIGPGAFAEAGGGVPQREALVREALETILVRPRDPGGLVVLQAQVRLSPDSLERLQQEIADLLARFNDPDAPTGEVMVVLSAGAAPR